MATVANGKDICLQGDKSDVQLYITAGCPKSVHLMEVRTDLASFGSIIPDNECFIAPVVEVLAPAQTDTSMYILRIPHCLTTINERNSVKIMLQHEKKHTAPSFVEVPPRDKCRDGVLFYDIDHSFIDLHTTTFCNVLCTICDKHYHCLDRATNFVFGNLYENKLENKGETKVEIRPYFCSTLYKRIPDLQEVS